MKRISEQDIKDVLQKMSEKARGLIGDKSRLKGLLNEAVEKADSTKDIKGPVGELIEKLQLLFSIIKDYVKGNYKDIPKDTLIAIVACLLYFVWPIDLIPDLLPGGLLDDAAVIAFVVKQIFSDLEKYKVWKASAAEA